MSVHTPLSDMTPFAVQPLLLRRALNCEHSNICVLAADRPRRIIFWRRVRRDRVIQVSEFVAYAPLLRWLAVERDCFAVASEDLVPIAAAPKGFQCKRDIFFRKTFLVFHVSLDDYISRRLGLRV